jgi:prevent-host-death family protein
MTTVTVREFRTHLAQYLNSGEEVVILSRGKPVAKITPSKLMIKQKVDTSHGAVRVSLTPKVELAHPPEKETVNKPITPPKTDYICEHGNPKHNCPICNPTHYFNPAPKPK